MPLGNFGKASAASCLIFAAVLIAVRDEGLDSSIEAKPRAEGNAFKLVRQKSMTRISVTGKTALETMEESCGLGIPRNAGDVCAEIRADPNAPECKFTEYNGQAKSGSGYQQCEAAMADTSPSFQCIVSNGIWSANPAAQGSVINASRAKSAYTNHIAKWIGNCQFSWNYLLGYYDKCFEVSYLLTAAGSGGKPPDRKLAFEQCAKMGILMNQESVIFVETLPKPVLDGQEPARMGTLIMTEGLTKGNIYDEDAHDSFPLGFHDPFKIEKNIGSQFCGDHENLPQLNNIGLSMCIDERVDFDQIHNMDYLPKTDECFAGVGKPLKQCDETGRMVHCFPQAKTAEPEFLIPWTQ